MMTAEFDCRDSQTAPFALPSRILDGQRSEILDESGASVPNLLNQSVNALADHVRSRLELKKIS
jgi:hypothetical protein